MIEEPAFIPFEVSELPAGPWLVFAPHADDETYGMGGSILRAVEQGIAVHVLVVTDGALGGKRENLVVIRRQEAAAAAAFLGITQLHCWEEPDRGVTVSPALIDKACGLILATRAATVFFPAAYEPHPDHRSTARLVWAALGQLLDEGRQAPLPVAYEIGVQSPINMMLDITAVLPQKQRAMQCYGSQNAENDYPDLVTALDQARTFSLPEAVRYAEAFFRFDREAPRESLKLHIDRYYEQYWQ